MADQRDLSRILQGLRNLNVTSQSNRVYSRRRQECRPDQLYIDRGSHAHGRIAHRADEQQTDAIESIRIVWLLRMAANGRDLQTPVILRYFKEPLISAYPMNLMEGFDSYVYPSECHNSLVRLEKYLMQAKTNDASGSSAFTFCSQRSCLRSILMMGFGNKDAFTVFATKLHNRIYMVKKEYTFEADPKYPSMKIRVNTFADSPGRAADPKRIANECEQTFAIYHAKFGKYELLYSGEVDGIKADEPVNDITDMEEINKCQFVRVRLGRDSFFKMTTFWVQGYLSNTDHIYVATKDTANIVHQPLEHKTLEEIQKKYKFSSRRSFRCLAGSLDFIAKVMANVNCPYTVYAFEFGKVDYSIEYKVHEDKNDLSFLSEEFIQFLEK